MAQVVGIVFSPGGKVYSFDPGGLELKWSDKVICRTTRGGEYGRVVEANHEVPREELAGSLKRVIRRAIKNHRAIVKLLRRWEGETVRVIEALADRKK